jgi:cytochrome P450
MADDTVVDLDYVKNHFSPMDPRLVGEGPLLSDGLWHAIDLMLEQCPVVKSDGQWFGCPDGGWVVNRYEDVMHVMHHPEIFSNRVKKGSGDWEPPQIPIDIDPPILVEYKRFLRPYFTMTAVSQFEPTAREIITRLIDKFIEAGHCADIVHEMAYPFSTRVQWTWLVGIDETDHDQLLNWIQTIIHRRFTPEFDDARSSWIGWLTDTLARRRVGPRQPDLIDGLFHSEFQGRPLTEDEIVRIMEIMIIGGVTTTADTISSILHRLAVYPELQDELRAHPELVPQAIEEFLRFESIVTGAPRRCTQDTELHGQQLKEGDQLFMHNAAANRDPREFENPHEFNIHRQRNRHLTFGAGHHRCIGSNFARQNLQIAMEEILKRMHNIRLSENDPPPVRVSNIARMLSLLPLTFDPGPRLLS